MIHLKTEAIFDNNAPDFSEILQDLLNHDLIGLNLLILERVEILPRYRGSGLGLKILRHMEDRFSAGAAVVAMKSYPLQFEMKPNEEEGKKRWRNLSLDELPKDKNAATKKLCQYYKKLGFVQIPEAPFLVRSTAWPFSSE